MQQQLEETQEVQISTSDPDSRQLITRNHITELGYNIQTTVDAQHYLTLDYFVTNTNDSKAMGQMVERAVDVLGHNEFTALHDKGYHTGTELKKAAELGLEVLVAIPAVSSHATEPVFDVSKFTHVAAEDYYVCPIGQHLRTNGRWYSKAHGKTTVQVKHYKTEHCLSCDFAARCTKNQAGRLIERSEYAPCYEANAKRIQIKEALYKRRQAIGEYGYGILKRQWGFYFISTKKTIKHAAADVGLMHTALNLRRIFNLVPKNVLQAYLKGLVHILNLPGVLLKLIRPFRSNFDLQQQLTLIFSMRL